MSLLLRIKRELFQEKYSAHWLGSSAIYFNKYKKVHVFSIAVTLVWLQAGQSDGRNVKLSSSVDLAFFCSAENN